jgi:leucyl/phenylalanyl-tRNA---protein transferase
MFARQPDASKVGLVTLSCHLQRWGFVLNDGKRDSLHLRKLGFRQMPRMELNALLAKACAQPGRQGCWAIDRSLDVALGSQATRFQNLTLALVLWTCRP